MSKPVYKMFEEFCDMLKVTNDFQVLKRKAWELVCAAKDEGYTDEAVLADDGTLHGAIDYWQNRALDAEGQLEFIISELVHYSEDYMSNVNDDDQGLEMLINSEENLKACISDAKELLK